MSGNTPLQYSPDTVSWTLFRCSLRGQTVSAKPCLETLPCQILQTPSAGHCLDTLGFNASHMACQEPTKLSYSTAAVDSSRGADRVKGTFSQPFKPKGPPPSSSSECLRRNSASKAHIPEAKASESCRLREGTRQKVFRAAFRRLRPLALYVCYLIPKSEIQAKFSLTRPQIAGKFRRSFNFQEKWPQTIHEKSSTSSTYTRNKILWQRDSGSGRPSVFLPLRFLLESSMRPWARLLKTPLSENSPAKLLNICQQFWELRVGLAAPRSPMPRIFGGLEDGCPMLRDAGSEAWCRSPIFGPPLNSCNIVLPLAYSY